MALEWQTVNVPLAAGMDTKADERALEAPAMTVCRNAQFDELGGLQKRKPYASLGGTAPSNVRRLARYRDELLLFTKERLYTWSDAEADWKDRGQHLAVKVEEESVFTRTSEQTLCDRAELDGVVVYAWEDDGPSGTLVYVAAADATTGATLVAPTSMGSLSTRPHLVALDTRIVLLYASASSAIVAKSIDPADPETGITGGATGIASIGTASQVFDVTRFSTDVLILAYQRATTTSYTALTWSALTKSVVTTVTPARTCDGPIAVAVDEDSGVFVVRGNGTSVRADMLDSDLADTASVNVSVGTAPGTPINQIAATVINDSASNDHRCFVAWTSQETAGASTAYQTQANYVDNAGSAGTAAIWRYRLSVASRAFTHDGGAYVWLTFGQGSSQTVAQLQNSYFLYRLDDGTDGAEVLDTARHLAAKAVMFTGGGFSAAAGHLPGVQSLGSNRYAWCAVERRIVPSASASAYAARSPRAVITTFDSDAARRTVQLGQTLYITGGQIAQYDGAQITEVGFHLFPHNLSVVDPGTSGNLEAGTYSWKGTLRWENAAGELERSTTANSFDQAIAASRDADISTSAIPATNKSSPEGALEIWRTVKDPLDTAPYYLVTSKDPTATGDNGYLSNDPGDGNLSTYTDSLADDDLIAREANPENGAVLEALAPPAATIIAAGDERLFIAGVAGQPYTIWYSKLRGEGEIAAFNDGLRVHLPASAGAITALAFLNETLIAFTATSIWALPGQGFDNIGGGANYGPAQLIATDVGAQSADVVATTPQGLIFHSSKGWFLLAGGRGVQYIGGPVEDYDDSTFVAVSVMEAQHQIRCVAKNNVILVYDYVVGQWSEWTVDSAIDAVLWDGEHTYLASDAVDGPDVRAQATTYTGVDYSMDVELAWIKLAGLQGFKRVRRIMVLGEWRGAHELRIRVARDYDATWFDDQRWTPSGLGVGSPEQVSHAPSIQKCEAIRVRLTDTAVGSNNPPSSEGLKLTGLALECGIKRGLSRRPAAQRQ